MAFFELYRPEVLFFVLSLLRHDLRHVHVACVGVLHELVRACLLSVGLKSALVLFDGEHKHLPDELAELLLT